ncbi:MAG: 3-hydroxyacyl-CoA dehydrogenase family protein [Chloroflexota bacterium]
MSIASILLIGEGDQTEQVQRLVTKSGAAVRTSTLEANYAGALANVDLVVEVVPEKLGLKSQVLEKCDLAAPPKTILATTTRYSGITELGAGTRRPDKVLGLCLTFNPFRDRCVVEIVKGLETGQEAVQACQELFRKAGAEVLDVSDAPGYVLDRVMAASINEAINMHMTGVASVEDIDHMLRICLGWPIGPFQFADTIGLDHILKTLENISGEQNPHHAPCRLLRKMVAAGKLGKKSGEGFYKYDRKQT